MTRKARGALYFLLVVALGTAAFLLKGPSDPGRRLYQRAEALLAAGDFESAAAAYGEVAVRYSRSQWADNALYKQGFILSNYLGRWMEAVRAFKALEQRPGSAFRDDGLLALAGIYETALVQPDAALDLYYRLCNEPGSASEVKSEAQVGVVRCLVNKGDEAAFAACETALREFPNQPDLRGQVEYLLARAYQTIRKDPVEAMRRYKDVTEKYPGTAWAAKAANELGWQYYEAMNKEKRTRVLLELPGVVEMPAVPGAGLAAPVFSALLGPKSGFSAEAFAGLSGEAFRFFYFPDAPTGGVETFYRNPFVATCEALGLPYSYQEFEQQQTAREALKRALFDGNAVVTSFAGPPPGWAIVIGSDATRGEIYVHDPFTKYRAYRSDEFTARWAVAPAPRSLLAGTQASAGAYPVFVLQGSTPKKGIKEAAAFAIGRALRDLREESAGKSGFASFRAYQYLIEQLEAPENESSADFLGKVAAWNASGSANLIGCRKALVAFLKEVAHAFPSGAEKHLLYAAEDYATEVELLQRARELLPTSGMLPEEEEAGRGRGAGPASEQLLKASAALRDALQYEHSAVSHLEEAMKKA